MKKNLSTLFSVKDPALRTERMWALLLMRIHFLLICLAPFGLVFYALLFYSTGELLLAVLALVFLFPVVAVLWGMWRLYFWAYASVLIFITVVSIAGYLQEPPLGMTIREMSGWVWSIISTCAAWRVRKLMPNRKTTSDQESINISSALPNSSTVSTQTAACSFRVWKPLCCCISILAAFFLLVATEHQYRDYNNFNEDYIFATQHPRPEEPPTKPSPEEEKETRGWYGMHSRSETDWRDLPANTYESRLMTFFKAKNLEDAKLFLRWRLTDISRWDVVNADREMYATAVKHKFIKLIVFGVLFAVFGIVFLFTLPSTICRIYIYLKNLPKHMDTPSKRIGAILSALSFVYLIYNFIIWCNFGGHEETYSLLLSMAIFFACMSILQGFPQRVLQWVKHGK